jgi:large subunit ribosomal protein L35
MPKNKTSKAAAKRFKITKTGKVMHGSQFGRHLRRKKSDTQKRRQQEPRALVGKFATKVKEMLSA